MTKKQKADKIYAEMKKRDLVFAETYSVKQLDEIAKASGTDRVDVMMFARFGKLF